MGRRRIGTRNAATSPDPCSVAAIATTAGLAAGFLALAAVTTLVTAIVAWSASNTTGRESMTVSAVITTASNPYHRRQEAAYALLRRIQEVVDATDLCPNLL